MLNYRLSFITSSIYASIFLFLCIMNKAAADALNFPDNPNGNIAVAKTTEYSFDKITSMAIAMEKDKNWETDTGKESIALLADDKIALRNLQGLRKLLERDMRGIADIFSDRASEPSTEDVQKALKVLAASPYTMATNALTVVYRGAGQAERVKAWVSIPAAQRAPLDDYMLQRYPTGGMNRRMLAQAALQMYQDAAPNAVPAPQAYLELALKIGIYPDGPIGFETALELAQARNIDGALAIVHALAAASPADPEVQRAAAEFVFSYAGVDAGVTFFQSAQERLGEPARREMRLGFLVQFSKTAHETKDAPSLSALQKMGAADDPLLAGDALLVNKQYPQAAAKFQQVLQTKHTIFEKRLDAWAGLLESDPAAAIASGPALEDVLATLSPAVRPKLLNWFGWQLWNACEIDLPALSHYRHGDWYFPHQPLETVPGGAVALAPLMQRLVDIDALPILAPQGNHPTWNSQPSDSLRVPAAFFYALASQPAKAVEILNRQLHYDIPPPPGGWKMFDGTADQHARTPRPALTPRDDEQATQYLTTLLDNLTRSAYSKQATPALADALASDLAGKLKADVDAKAQVQHIHALAAVLAFDVLALDPLPPGIRMDAPTPAPHVVDMARYTPVDDAIRQALALDAVAKQAPLLIREGITPAMRVAGNAKLLDALFALLNTLLDRYQASGASQASIAYEVNNAAGNLSIRKIYNLKSYAAQLRMKYPQVGK